MFKAILGGVVGLVMMNVFVFVTFGILYAVLKADGTFEEASWDPSMMWIVVTFILSLIAAIIGGLICAKIALAESKAPMVLAIVVLVLGLAMGGLAMVMPEPEEKPERTSDIGMKEAMMQAEQPLYVSFLNPVIGAVGVLIGARMGRKKPASSPE